MDEEDLGRISVLIGPDWTTIPGPRQMEGVSLTEWVERQNELARRHGEQARLDFDQFVAPALIDIEREAKRAEEFFDLGPVHRTADMMDQMEKDLRVFVLYDRDPEGDERGLTKDTALLGSVRGRSSAAAIPQSIETPGPQVATNPSGQAQAAPSMSAPIPTIPEPVKPTVLQRKRSKKVN